MRQLVECVPNFSEGRNQEIIDAIGSSVKGVDGAKLLNIEPDEDYNRTVVTFVGTPAAVVEAAFQATKTAAERIDMSKHSGEHPRIGAADVVPFIPICGVTMDDCVRLSNIYGERVARELKIPVFLYECAARMQGRKNLSDIRQGEYEGLAAKLQRPEWKPDYGGAIFNERSGATVSGARKFLIAYNVNLNTSDQKLAQEIASHIRESGRAAKDDRGKPIMDEKGEIVKLPGILKAVKAMGVFLERHGIAQVSMNLTDFETTSMHAAYEEVKRQARSLGIDATGSELVGLAPLQAILKAGEFYSGGRSLSEQELVSLAVEKLGLNQLEPFTPRKKIIEYQIDSY
jgi:glutamate formiminotransferase/formiminotetrahydrofolate cyclodeaminase